MSGRVMADPQLRFSPSGTAVCTFTVIHQDRKFDQEAKQWVDNGDALFANVVAWKTLGEQAADKLTKRDQVVVTGVLRQKNWEKDGQKRSGFELVADEIGVSVRNKDSALTAPQQEELPPW